MKIVTFLLFTIVTVLLVVSYTAAATNKVVCYYGTWAVYRNGNGKVSVGDINPNICTHIIYTFVGLTSTGTVRMLDSYLDIDLGGYASFIALKNKNPSVKLMVAIGGWNEGSTTYSTVVNNPTLRATLVNSIVSFTKQYKFDGFDLDWEYPGDRGGIPSDKAAFVELLKELRGRFNTEGLLLSAAVGASSSFIQTAYDVPSLSAYLDFINLMTYDYYGGWSSQTGHHSPLYSSVDTTVKAWIAAGANPQKIVLGIGTYGNTYSLANPSNNGMGAAITGPGLGGPYTYSSGTLTYLEICEKQKTGGWTIVWDNYQQVPYSYSGNQWIGYDNVQSVVNKAKYAIDKNLAGVMVWSIESDDVRGVCGQGSYPLITAMYNTIKSGSGGSGVTEPPSTSTGTTTTTTTTTTTAKPSTGICNKEGYIRDPVKCNIFYYCQLNGASYITHTFTCPTNLVFNTATLACDYNYNVAC